ncbi:MAG: 23S rRNA (guanosine(2251)-2'-O)-methyltransferase RlmB [Candidatus Lightella neohaematopini]|nr:23S rRNA (guanosine(2251)-2'-O)-methyltransferase RlmB [Candidatus Lightella neohaematopini]MCV2528982.1 23S rRNA (guanosine(2251)-2'-O)-methyltransferase RlmB [Candidatus Lightella neohaematopini]
MYIIYGINTIQTLLDHNYKYFNNVLISKKNNKRIKIIINKLSLFKIKIDFVNDKLINKIVGNVVHQGIIAYINKKKYVNKLFLINLINTKNKLLLILILDGITDPHNLGSCLRSAYSANVDLVIIPKYNSVKLSSTVYKISSGAANIIPILMVNNLNSIIKILKNKGIRIIGTDDKSNNILYKSNLSKSLALVIGSENYGMCNLVRRSCDEIINIPTRNDMKSINLSIATGVILFEIVRQRNLF